jgi:hypothetical protein
LTKFLKLTKFEAIGLAPSSPIEFPLKYFVNRDELCNTLDLILDWLISSSEQNLKQLT